MSDNTAAVTNKQLQAEVQAELKKVISGTVKAVKGYVDEHSIDNTVKREDLQNEITEAIAKKYDFKSEKEKLEKASGVANTLLGLFDTDGNNEIDPKEFLGKLNSIYSQLGTTTKISNDLVALAKQVTDNKSYTDTKIGEVTGNMKTLAVDLSEVKEFSKKVRADLDTEFFTKSDVKSVLAFSKEEILAEVESILGMKQDQKQATKKGNGATL